MHSSTMIAELSHAYRGLYQYPSGKWQRLRKARRIERLKESCSGSYICPHCPPLRCPAADSHVHLTQILIDRTPIQLAEHLELTDCHQVVKGGMIASD